MHSTNLSRFVQTGLVLTAVSLSSYFMASRVIACSCIQVWLTQVCCRTEEKRKQNPDSQLGLDIRLLVWQSF